MISRVRWLVGLGGLRENRGVRTRLSTVDYLAIRGLHHLSLSFQKLQPQGIRTLLAIDPNLDLISK